MHVGQSGHVRNAVFAAAVVLIPSSCSSQAGFAGAASVIASGEKQAQHFEQRGRDRACVCAA
eukprot:8210430-Lingulodinium_polyedra.AAC.1